MLLNRYRSHPVRSEIDVLNQKQPTQLQTEVGLKSAITIIYEFKKLTKLENTNGQTTLDISSVPLNCDKDLPTEANGLLPNVWKEFEALADKIETMLHKQEPNNVWLLDMPKINAMILKTLGNTMNESYILDVYFEDAGVPELSFHMYYYVMLGDIQIATRELSIITDLYMRTA